METSKFISINLRGWPLNHQRHLDSINGLVSLVRKEQPAVVGVQEFVPGKNKWYWNKLKEILPDYIFFTPLNYDWEAHWRSAINLLLVKREKGISFVNKTLALPNDPELDFSGLYNWLEYTDTDGLKHEIFHMHAVQLSNDGKPIEYQKMRLKLHNAFWQAVHEQVLVNNNISLIIMGDFNADSTDVNIKLIGSVLPDTFRESDSPVLFSYIDPAGNSHRYDHIFATSGRSYLDPAPVLAGYSDHAAVIYEPQHQCQI